MPTSRDRRVDLASLARDQGVLIETGDADALLRVLHERQTLINRLLQVIGDLGPLAEAVQESKSGVTEGQRTTVRSLLSRFTQRLAEVIENDARDRERLEERLATLSRERNVNDIAQSARKAYGRSKQSTSPLSAVPNRFTDQKG